MAHKIPKISLEEWKERCRQMTESMGGRHGGKTALMSEQLMNLQAIQAKERELRSAQEQHAYLRGCWAEPALRTVDLDQAARDRAYARAIKTRTSYTQCLQEEAERRQALLDKQAWHAGVNYDFKPGDEISIDGQKAVVTAVRPGIHDGQIVEVKPARGLYRLSSFYAQPVEDPDLVSVKDALWPAYVSGDAYAAPAGLRQHEVEDKPVAKDEIKPELLRKRVSEW